MAKLFVSYSRRDSVAARKLIEAFRSIEQDVWVDWESIPPAVDWLEQIFRGIEEADAFIFMISPDSIASEVCKVEINRAAQNNKRIIPIVLRDVQPKDAPESIRKLNWTFIRETDNFEEGLAKVKTAIELDLDWLEEHRRLQVRSLEWHRKKDPSLLLRGRDLRNARHMIATATSKDPIPTELQQKFIQYSLQSERNRTIAWIATGITVIALTILTFLAIGASNEAQVQRNEAQIQKNIAETKAVEARDNEVLARQFAATSQANAQAAMTQRAIANANEVRAEAGQSAARAQISQSRPGELYLSTLLAIDSMQRYKTDEAEEILRRNISLLPLPLAQFSQQGRINAIAVSPEKDRNIIVTASADGTTCAWQIENGEARDLFCTPSGQPSVNAVAFNLDGSLLAVGDQSGLVQILDMKENGTVLYAYQRGQTPSGAIQLIDIKNGAAPNEDIQAPVRSLAFQPRSGGHLAVAYGDGEIPVFNPTTGKVSSPLWTGESPNIIGFNRSGNWLVAGTQSGRVVVWDLSGSHNFSPSTHRGGVLAFAFSPKENNKVATGGNDNTAAIINLSIEKQQFRLFNQDSVRDVAFSPDGAWLVTGSDDHQIRIWDALSGDELLAMSQDGIVTDVVVSPNGQWLATTGDDRTTRVWDAKTGAEIFQIPLDASGALLAFSNDGEYLVSTDQNGGIDIWNMSGLAARLDSISFDGIMDNAQYSPSGELLALSEGNRIWLLGADPDSGLVSRPQSTSSISLDSNAKDLIFSPDAKFLGISTDGKDVAVYDIENRKLKQVEVTTATRSIAFSMDSQQLITNDPDGNIQVWNVLDAKLMENTDQEYPPALSFATSSELLALGSKDKIQIMGLDGNGGSSEIEAPGENSLLAFNQAGTVLASTDSSGRIQIWNYQGGEFVAVPPLIKQQAASLALNAKGTLLAVGTAQNVFLIDTTNGKEIARIPHRDIVSGVSFSSDGKYLTTASYKVLQVWEIAKIEQIKRADLIPTACARLAGQFNEAQLDALFDDSATLCDSLLKPE
jgi:WD40 repeat protein